MIGGRRDGAGRRPGPNKLTYEQQNEMLRRYIRGDESTAAIAADYGVNPSYPTQLAKRRGITMRSER